MKLIISGSKSFNDYSLLSANVIRILKENDGVNGREKFDFNSLEIITGGSLGTDKLGETFAKNNNIQNKIFTAQWNIFGSAAALSRNTDMINYVANSDDDSILIAFWDNQDRTTEHIIQTAKEYNIPVYVINTVTSEE